MRTCRNPSPLGKNSDTPASLRLAAQSREEQIDREDDAINTFLEEGHESSSVSPSTRVPQSLDTASTWCAVSPQQDNVAAEAAETAEASGPHPWRDAPITSQRSRWCLDDTYPHRLFNGDEFDLPMKPMLFTIMEEEEEEED